MGRHSEYTEDKANAIIDLLATGISLVSVCKELNIGYSTVMTWLTQHLDFQENYARVREHQIDFLAEDILTIADDKSMTPDDRRIAIDARKWYSGKMKPKKYGDSINQKHTDGDGQPLKVNDAAQAVLALLTTEQLEKALADVTNKAESVE